MSVGKIVIVKSSMNYCDLLGELMSVFTCNKETSDHLDIHVYMKYFFIHVYKILFTYILVAGLNTSDWRHSN